MDVLDGRSVWSLSEGEMMPAFDAVDAEIIRLQNVRLQLIARIEDTGHAEELGARDAVELVSRRHRRDRAEAWRDVRLARALPRYSAIATALADGIEIPEVPAAQGSDRDSTADAGEVMDAGEVTGAGEPAGGGDEGVRVVRPMQTAQAAAIVFELERVRSRVPVDDLDVAEEQLVRLAAHLAPAELRAAAKEICNLLDSDGPEPEEKKAYERESLTLTNADKGVKFKGYLANENAELLRAVVHAGARPHKTADGEQDPRPREKRQADALSAALTIAANAWDTASTGAGAGAGVSAGPGTQTPAGGDGAGDGPVVEKTGRVPGYGAKACITVTIDLQDLKAATADAIGRTVYGDGLSAAAIRRLACDAHVIPVVLGTDSEPLDVGRRERLVTRAMRRALNTRDRGCVVCGAPPIMCDAHHLISWIDGGETKIDNLVLLCRRDHTDLHNGRWTVTITDGAVHVDRPAWADPPPLVRSGPPAFGSNSAADSQSPPSTPSADPWGGTVSPVASRTPAHARRWNADAATYAEAARFAVWRPAAPDAADTGPPSFATI